MGEEIIIVPIVFLSLVTIVKTISDNRLRKYIIEKGELDPAVVSTLMGSSSQTPHITSVKWAFVLISIGVAFLLIGLIPAFGQWDDPVQIGVLLLCAGLGFVGYYLFATKKMDNA